MAPSSRRLMSSAPFDRQPPAVSVADGGRWQQSARCRGLPSNVFFPEGLYSRRQRRLQEQAAKQVCVSCPVIVACREHALRAPEKYGVWGALTARERFTRW
jgi:WhiB family redox-sensing transcriptional regulator